MQRNRCLDGIAKVFQCGRHHFRFERPGRNRIHSDVFAGKTLRENSCELMYRSFGSGVRIGLECWHVNAVDRADIDDACRVGRRCASNEFSVQEACELEHAFHVDVENFVPCRIVEVVERSAPGCARVIHKNVERSVAPFANRTSEAKAFGFSREVGRKRNAVGAEFGGDGIADVGFAR